MTDNKATKKHTEEEKKQKKEKNFGDYTISTIQEVDVSSS